MKIFPLIKIFPMKKNLKYVEIIIIIINISLYCILFCDKMKKFEAYNSEH